MTKIAPEPPRAYECGTRQYERVTVDASIRMRINGETAKQMAHAAQVKATAPYMKDTTVDQPWEVQAELAATDRKLLMLSVLYLLPKVLLLYLPMVIIAVPWALLARCYVSFQPTPNEVVRRSTAGFPLYVALSAVLLAPGVPLWAFARLLDRAMYFFFGFFFLVGTRGGWERRRRGLAAIAPYTNGPSIRFSDLCVCAMGQTARNGALEFASAFVVMVLAIPWLKYFVLCNPWAYDLSERFVQQISTSLADCGVAKVHEAARRIISRSHQEPSLRRRMDLWQFCPHYPYPPPGRRWANGLQHANKLCLIVHTTHAVAEAEGSVEQFVFSNSCEEPIWRVMLWHNNPYHFLTGFVEASIGNGAPSQLDKRHGGEHPMWLVAAHNPNNSARKGMMALGPGGIDAFFDRWLPVIVDETRSLVRGAAVARQMHQQVVSKEGISRPAAEVGVDAAGSKEAPAWNPRAAGDDEGRG
jgi:hypothetical protein